MLPFYGQLNQQCIRAAINKFYVTLSFLDKRQHRLNLKKNTFRRKYCIRMVRCNKSLKFLVFLSLSGIWIVILSWSCDLYLIKVYLGSFSFINNFSMGCQRIFVWEVTKLFIRTIILFFLLTKKTKAKLYLWHKILWSWNFAKLRNYFNQQF